MAKKLNTTRFKKGTSDDMIEGLEKWKQVIGYRRWLDRVLKENGCFDVYDAAMGVGYDVDFLVRRGYNVSGNDIDSVAFERAKKIVPQGTNQVTQYDWREIPRIEDEGNDAVLCLGNSLTYLSDRNNQLKALNRFWDILKVGGVLVIDERNYQYMFDHANEIRDGSFEYPGAYRLAPQTGVQGVPVEIDDNHVLMEFRNLEARTKYKHTFYPFKRNELLGLLRESGFRTITQYYDYHDSNTNVGYNNHVGYPCLASAFVPKADFYQYVCSKGRRR